MKKLALVICLLVASLGARAQFEQGKYRLWHQYQTVLSHCYYMRNLIRSVTG